MAGVVPNAARSVIASVMAQESLVMPAPRDHLDAERDAASPVPDLSCTQPRVIPASRPPARVLSTRNLPIDSMNSEPVMGTQRRHH